MKIKIILCTVAAIGLTLTSCKKTGDFTTDKDTYKQGEVIKVTNTTEKASEFYKWDFGGTEIVDENPEYEIPENTPVGSFTISVLPVNSLNTTDNWKRGSRTVKIEEAEEAKVIFFLPNANLGGQNEEWTIDFTINNEIVSKTVNTIASSFPSCESNNNFDAATFDNLASGDYSFTVRGTSSNGFVNITDAVNLEDGFDCRIINLSNY